MERENILLKRKKKINCKQNLYTYALCKELLLPSGSKIVVPVFSYDCRVSMFIMAFFLY